jgi:hypothetical protein
MTGGAAQQRANSRQHFFEVKRLGDVVVGAELEAHDPVDVLAAGGEHDDRQ